MSFRDDSPHWTQTLFRENAHLYLPFLEDAKERASGEADILAGLLSELDVPEGGKVLDVACGIGRHGVPLALTGYRVSGLDISELFIREARIYAESAGATVNFVSGDALDVQRLMSEDSPFDAVINMFTSHGYHGRAGDLGLFRRLRGLVCDGAALVVLTSNRDWIIRNFQPEGMERAGKMRVLQSRRLDLGTSTMHNRWQFYEGARESLALRLTLDMEHRLYSLHELAALLEEAGWSFVQGLGRPSGNDEPLGPLSYDHNAMWAVARATREADTGSGDFSPRFVARVEPRTSDRRPVTRPPTPITTQSSVEGTKNVRPG